LDDVDAEIMLTDKQWYNEDEKVLIEYMFSIDFKGMNGSSGLMIYNSPNIWCGNYYIGIETYSEGLRYQLTLEYHNETNQNYLDSQYLNISKESYTLSIVIENGTNFVISVDDVQYISFGHDNTNVLNDGYSGYISIVSSKGIISNAKTLCISGTPINVTNALWINNCNSTTFDPTANQITSGPTTDDPTTANPTLSPFRRKVMTKNIK